MTNPVFAVRDVLNGFMAPMVDLSDEAAIRNFKYALSHNDMMAFQPRDYDLFKLGSYCYDTGVFTPLDLPMLVFRGCECEV